MIGTTIHQKLNEIEERENVRILHCVESGSRAWGFASPDSDYDVRFIYVRPIEFYLKLGKTRDVIEWQLDETLDINGWDLQKALRLLHSSNPTLFEWARSPIVYRTTETWQQISQMFDGYFVLRSGLYHYLSTAVGNYRDHLKGDTVKLKKYFYVLRPLLACRWILKDQTPPPMLFRDLVDACLDEELKPVVDDLVKRKMQTPEIGAGPRIDALNAYIERSIPEIDAAIQALPEERKKGWVELDRVFAEVVMEGSRI